MTKKIFDYTKTRTELDEIMAWFESSDVAVDEAIAKYKQAEKLLAELEQYLSDTQTQIEIFAKQSKGD